MRRVGSASHLADVSDQEEDYLKGDWLALGIHGSKWIFASMIWVAVGYLSPALLRERQILLTGRAIFFCGHLLAFWLYRQAMWKINEAYTSYRGGIDYGYTNVEKAAIREGLKRVIRIIALRGAVAAMSHYCFLSWVTPLLVTSTLGYGTLLNNPHVVSTFWEPSAVRRPVGFIPRSTSGRLL